MKIRTGLQRGRLWVDELRDGWIHGWMDASVILYLWQKHLSIHSCYPIHSFMFIPSLCPTLILPRHSLRNEKQISSLTSLSCNTIEYQCLEESS